MTYAQTLAPAAGQYHSDLPAEELIAQIDRLRREQNAVILAHNLPDSADPRTWPTSRAIHSGCP